MSTEFTAVARLADLGEGVPMKVTVDDQDIALVNTEGQVFAIEDRCSHGDVALSEGEVEGCFIECWLHGSQFDLRTGVPTSPPAVQPVDIYETKIEGTGDAAQVLVKTK